MKNNYDFLTQSKQCVDAVQCVLLVDGLSNVNGVSRRCVLSSGAQSPQEAVTVAASLNHWLTALHVETKR
jgi:hypothetical protein